MPTVGDSQVKKLDRTSSAIIAEGSPPCCTLFTLKWLARVKGPLVVGLLRVSLAEIVILPFLL